MVETFTIKSQWEELFQQWFPGCRTELNLASPSEKVGGFVIWQGFDGQTQKQRQAVLWSHLRTLPLLNQLQISAIFTITEDELASMRENE